MTVLVVSVGYGETFLFLVENRTGYLYAISTNSSWIVEEALDTVCDTRTCCRIKDTDVRRLSRVLVCW